MVDFGHNGLYFSLEMSAKRLGINSIANEFGLNSQDVNKGKVQQGYCTGYARTLYAG